MTLPEAPEGPWRLRWDSAWERPEDGAEEEATAGTLTPLSLRLYTT